MPVMYSGARGPQYSTKRMAGEGLLRHLLRVWGNANMVMPGVGVLNVPSGAAKLAGPAASAASTAASDLVELFSGGPSGTFWSTDPTRAASYGAVRSVSVPRAVFEAGRAQASKLGQPTRFDTTLPAEWVNRAVSAPHVKPTVHAAEELPPAAVDALLSALGVKRF